jgi:L-aminopeptidase/D-esterase-like protein
MAGVRPGGLGSASIDLGDGLIVGALVAANPVGSVYMPDGETFWAWPFEIDGEFGGRRPGDMASAIDPLPDDTKLGARLAAGANTTLALIATTADLTTAEAQRMAMMAHDGMARAVRPAHTPFDGDVVFALASGAAPLGEDPIRGVMRTRLGSAAADCLARALARAVYETRTSQ